MVTKPQMREQIAKVLGWTDLKWFQHPDEEPGKLDLVGFKKNGDYGEVPNWPTDRNARYELLKEERLDWYEGLRDARTESLEWLLYKGWRWVGCDCKHECPEWDFMIIKRGQPEFDACLCNFKDGCNGDGGEWVKEGAERSPPNP